MTTEHARVVVVGGGVIGCAILREFARRGIPGILIEEEPDLSEAPVQIVGLCRSISRGEIEQTCRHSTEPRTPDAVKRRDGAAFGDCQSNLCNLDVARIVAAERAIPITAVEKHRRGSCLGAGDGRRPASADAREAQALPACTVVLVIRGGTAGRAAATAAPGSGASVVLVDRQAGESVVGLSKYLLGGWDVLVQSATGSTEATAGEVIIATGGHVEPREHRPIAGGRPAGVMTSDLAWQLLREGLRPGGVVALVGDGPAVVGLAKAMAGADATVVPLIEAPDAPRGEVRLDAVHTQDDWPDVGTVVLADRLQPHAFLLRGLGLTDGRSGHAAPADADGRLSLHGLRAAGCDVNPTFDHHACAEQGRLVGRRAALAAVVRNRASVDECVAAR